MQRHRAWGELLMGKACRELGCYITRGRGWTSGLLRSCIAQVVGMSWPVLPQVLRHYKCWERAWRYDAVLDPMRERCRGMSCGIEWLRGRAWCLYFAEVVRMLR
ncbi:hypothetical protein GH714_044003 [Hevea brasiliensis]|uniref:Uncharacterized protein n=1 Tax=Hevea brasiliensis TaxID=3981 RepID=A0A6A6K0D0_HEVBR|nr:hypothetical protein GH714_044003 [Hevea brasiliensis]